MCAQHDQCRCARSQFSLFNLLKLVYRENNCWKVKMFFQNFFVEKCKILVRTENIFFPFCFPRSGTAIMQDGNTMRNNYGCDLDSLTTGSRIGMMRSASGDLHYYINGVDQGVACSGLPPGRKLYELEDLTEATHTPTTTSSKSATLSLCTSSFTTSTNFL